jgi:hypothetical protein
MPHCLEPDERSQSQKPHKDQTPRAISQAFSPSKNFFRQMKQALVMFVL